MEDKIKEIIAGFLKISPSRVSADTPIDRKSIGSSIAVHRMYARLSEIGVPLHNYHTIATYGDLLLRRGHGAAATTTAELLKPEQNAVPAASNGSFAAVGIDIENTHRFQRVDDYRADDFYKMNFSNREISYAIIQPDPVQTFAGLFAAKEAIIKADNRFKPYPFKDIEIQYTVEGKPLFQDLSVSISHINELAVAVAVAGSPVPLEKTLAVQNKTNTENTSSSRLVAWLAVLLSLLAILLHIVKW